MLYIDIYYFLGGWIKSYMDSSGLNIYEINFSNSDDF